ncbi:MAG TPA: hypothetical protein VM866_03850 [Pyrinomonadaceae bacterium]|jgi:hypothetical protein|nr:hypothetical protein [Pyrinomonadaceae bacterium]
MESNDEAGTLNWDTLYKALQGRASIARRTAPGGDFEKSVSPERATYRRMSPFSGLEKNTLAYLARCAGLLNVAPSGLGIGQPLHQ